MLSKIHVLKFYLQRYLFFRILKKYLNFVNAKTDCRLF